MTYLASHNLIIGCKMLMGYSFQICSNIQHYSVLNIGGGGCFLFFVCNQNYIDTIKCTSLVHGLYGQLLLQVSNYNSMF